MSGFTFRGQTALVTGAGSGIGRALAKELALRGCRLALCDVNHERLVETADLLEAEVTAYTLDVTDRAAIASLPTRIRDDHGGLSLLVNNAGIAAGGRFWEISEEHFDRVMAVNFEAPVRLTRAFLPMLREAKEARIVNLSSVNGIVASPGQTAYSASKFALRGFSTALGLELRGTNVGVTTVHPGGVRTNIALDAILPEAVDPAKARIHRDRFDRLLRLPSQTAAKVIVDGVARRKQRVIVGRDAKVMTTLERLMPVSNWSVIGRFMG